MSEWLITTIGVLLEPLYVYLDNILLKTAEEWIINRDDSKTSNFAIEYKERDLFVLLHLWPHEGQPPAW